MEFPKLFYKTDLKRLETKSELKGVYFTKPRLVAFYDINYDIIKPAKRILYFKMPKTQNYPIDLNHGFTKYIIRNRSQFQNSLEYTLKYAMSPEAQVNVGDVDKIKIYTRRGTLVNLVLCWYGKRFDKFTIRATRYNGDLYMVHVDDPVDLSNALKPSNTHHEQFLKTVFTESLKDEPKIDDPCDENKRLIGVHQSSFGKFEMIYHGEIQGIQANKELKDFDDLENINDCRFVMAKQMWSSLRNSDLKHLQYWLQAHLANVLDVYFAYKDKVGIVHRPIVRKPTSQLPKECNWKPGVCTEFLYEFLQRVNELLTNDDIDCLNTVYEIYFDIKEKTFTYKIFKENANVIFITQEYMDYCKKL